MRLFLRAHGVRPVLGRVVQAGLLRHPLAARQEVGLAADFVLQGVLHELERVQVLQLGLGAQGGLAARAQRHVGVAAQRPLLHVAVGHAEVDQGAAQAGVVGVRLFGRSQIGLADDLDQRHAGAVEVDVRLAVGIREAFVQQLAGVLLHMDAGDADAPGLSPRFDVEVAADRQRPVVHRDLVPLRQVGIEIILAREDRQRLDIAAESQGGAQGELPRPPVENRQRAGHAQAHRADVGVGGVPEAGGAAAEDLRFGEELAVHFEADDRFVFHAAPRGAGREL